VTSIQRWKEAVIRKLVNGAEVAICILITHIESKMTIHTCNTCCGMCRCREVLHGILMAVLTQCGCVFGVSGSTRDCIHPGSLWIMTNDTLHATVVMCA